VQERNVARLKSETPFMLAFYEYRVCFCSPGPWVRDGESWWNKRRMTYSHLKIGRSITANVNGGRHAEACHGPEGDQQDGEDPRWRATRPKRSK